MFSTRIWLSLLLLALLFVGVISQGIEATSEEGGQSAPPKSRGQNNRGGNRGRGRGRGRGNRGRGRGGRGSAGGGQSGGGNRGSSNGGQPQPRYSQNTPVTYSAPSGTIKSPGYPNGYSNNIDRTWVILATGNNRIKLEFTDINIEPQKTCEYDYVQVLDFRLQSMGKRCGRWSSYSLSLPQHTIESPFNMTIKFHSDNSKTFPGFEAKWTTLTSKTFPGCQEQINEIDGTTPGTLSSPEFPDHYLPFLDCHHVISVNPDQVIRLTLQPNKFDVEYEPACAYDFLEIFDGQSIEDPVLGNSRLCGDGNNGEHWQHHSNGFPTSLTSTSNFVLVKFHSDGSLQKTGWEISYTAIPRPDVNTGGDGDGDKVTEACSGGVVLLNEESGIFTSMHYGEREYPLSTVCKWKIQVPKDKIAVIEFDDFELETQAQCRYDSLTIHAGSDENAPILRKLCGSNVPQDVRGISNELFVVFYSDHSVAKRGFRAIYSAKEPIDYSGQCGMSEIPQKITKIVGGQVATAYSWPWMVAVQKRSSQFSNSWGLWCGGSIVSPTWVLTAAHCVDTEGNTDPAYLFRIVAGDHNRYENEGTEQGRMVIQIVKHANYSDATTDNDIALLKLDRPITYDRYVQPICLPSQEAPPLTLCATTGWGATNTNTVPSPEGSSRDNTVLNQVFVPVLETATCLDTRLRFSLTNNMFCAGHLEGGKDTCQGDSGGPFMCKSNNAYIQFGITSWGYGCAERNSPGVYTQVCNYIPWILRHVTDHHSRAKRDVAKQETVVKRDFEPIVETYTDENTNPRFAFSRLKSALYNRK